MYNLYQLFNKLNMVINKWNNIAIVLFLYLDHNLQYKLVHTQNTRITPIHINFITRCTIWITYPTCNTFSIIIPSIPIYTHITTWHIKPTSKTISLCTRRTNITIFTITLLTICTYWCIIWTRWTVSTWTLRQAHPSSYTLFLFKISCFSTHQSYTRTSWYFYSKLIEWLWLQI